MQDGIFQKINKICCTIIRETRVSFESAYLVLPEDGAVEVPDDVPPFPLVWLMVEVEEAAAAAAAAAEVQNS